MKILFAPVSKDVNESELTAIQDICRLEQPDQVKLCIPVGFAVEVKESLKELGDSFDIAVTYYDAENPSTAVDFIKEYRADHPDDTILVNSLGGSEELQAALLPLASDDTVKLILTDGSEPAEIPAEETAEPDAPVSDSAPEGSVASDETAAESEPDQPDPETIKKDAVTAFGKSLLSELVDSYDYHGAYVLSQKLGTEIPEIVPFLL